MLVIDESGLASATNTITLVASGSNTINGSTGVISQAYGHILLESNGVGAWFISATKRANNVISIGSSTTYTHTAGITGAQIFVFGLGGGGARQVAGSAASGGAGGGGGGLVSTWLDVSLIASSVSITMGTGGTAGTAAASDNSAGGNGGTGGVTSFGTMLHAAGGGGAGGQLGTGSGGGGAYQTGSLGSGVTGGNGGAGGVGAASLVLIIEIF